LISEINADTGKKWENTHTYIPTYIGSSHPPSSAVIADIYIKKKIKINSWKIQKKMKYDTAIKADTLENEVAFFFYIFVNF
jgi:hypothetical protein